MHREDYEKLKHPENFSLTALLKLSKLRRKLSEYGYEFFGLKEGEIILLLETARLLDCTEAKTLAGQFLQQVGVQHNEFIAAGRQHS